MNRSLALMTLTEGNIFHATTPNGASFICLVTSVAKSQIWARRVTTQEQLVFDRAAGIAEIGDTSVACTIDSIAPLPTEIREVMVQLDTVDRLRSQARRRGVRADELASQIGRSSDGNWFRPSCDG
jgi:hypothetical protein